MGIDLKDTVPKTRIPLSVIPNQLMDFAFMDWWSVEVGAHHRQTISFAKAVELNGGLGEGIRPAQRKKESRKAKIL